MTCRYHIEPAEGCMGCLGRWDRLLAEQLLREGCPRLILAAALHAAISELDARETEATVTFEAMRAEITRLTFCEHVGEFYDGEMEPGRAAAFQVHVATCKRCEMRLEGLMKAEALLRETAPDPMRKR